jgi:hypothetical protein
MESEYGIFVSDAGKDIEKKQKLEALAQAMVQNGTPASVIADIISSDSFSQIKDKIVQAEKQAEELRKAQEEAEAQMKQQQIEANQRIAEMASIDKEKDRQTTIEVALINAETSEKGANASIEKMLKDFEVKQQEIALKERELDIKASQNTVE